jgi:hypothetical protein
MECRCRRAFAFARKRARNFRSPLARDLCGVRAIGRPVSRRRRVRRGDPGVVPAETHPVVLQIQLEAEEAEAEEGPRRRGPPTARSAGRASAGPGPAGSTWTSPRAPGLTPEQEAAAFVAKMEAERASEREFDRESSGLQDGEGASSVLEDLTPPPLPVRPPMPPSRACAQLGRASPEEPSPRGPGPSRARRPPRLRPPRKRERGRPGRAEVRALRDPRARRRGGRRLLRPRAHRCPARQRRQSSNPGRRGRASPPEIPATEEAVRARARERFLTVDAGRAARAPARAGRLAPRKLPGGSLGPSARAGGLGELPRHHPGGARGRRRSLPSGLSACAGRCARRGGWPRARCACPARSRRSRRERAATGSALRQGRRRWRSRRSAATTRWCRRRARSLYQPATGTGHAVRRSGARGCRTERRRSDAAESGARRAFSARCTRERGPGETRNVREWVWVGLPGRHDELTGAARAGGPGTPPEPPS